MCLAFAVVVGAADDLAMCHVRTLLTSTLSINLTHFVAALDRISAHLLAILLVVRLLRILDSNSLLDLLSGHMLFGMIASNSHCLFARHRK